MYNNIKKIGAFTVEQAKALFFDTEALKEPAYQLYRLDGGSSRYYFTPTAEGIKYFVSVTSLIRDTTPTSEHLIQWRINNGENAGYMSRSAMAYGTLMHIEAQKLIIQREYDLEAIPDVVEAYQKEAGYVELAGEWSRKLAKDMMSVMAFVQIHNVKPIAIEPMLASVELGVAGAVDLVCEMDHHERIKGFHGEVYKSGAKKGQAKETTIDKTTRVTAIVDFKSGAHAYDDHAIQLGLYKELVKENFGIKVDKLFNWNTKDWRSKPDYNLTDQTDNKLIELIPHLVAIYKIKHPSIEPARPNDYMGKLSMDSDLMEHFEKKDVSDILQEAVKNF